MRKYFTKKTSTDERKYQRPRPAETQEDPLRRGQPGGIYRHRLAGRLLVGRTDPPVLGVCRTRLRSGDSQRRGGDLQADSWSDPEDESGYSAHDLLSLGFKKSNQHAQLLQNTRSIEGVRVEDYDAIFLVGGQSPMFTFIEHGKLHRLVADFHAAGKVTALVCHATCILLKAKDAEGNLLVKGKTWTGFANSEEQFADQYVGQRIQPFWIEEEARKIPDSNFIVQGMFKAHAVRDGHLITGQQQYSGVAAARLVIEALGV